MILTALAMITGSTVGFYVLALVAIFASLRVIMHTNPVHALLAMIVSLLAIAGIFFSLGAPFAGALEIIVYAGAILVLFVFVVMMLNLGGQSEIQEKSWLDAKTWAVPMGLAFIIGLIVINMIGMSPHTPDGQAVVATANWIGGEPVTAKMVGVKLFTEYLLVVEIAGFILLGALVAAYHLAKKSLSDEAEDHTSLIAPQLTLNNTVPNIANLTDVADVKEVLKETGIKEASGVKNALINQPSQPKGSV